MVRKALWGNDIWKKKLIIQLDICIVYKKNMFEQSMIMFTGKYQVFLFRQKKINKIGSSLYLPFPMRQHWGPLLQGHIWQSWSSGCPTFSLDIKRRHLEKKWGGSPEAFDLNRPLHCFSYARGTCITITSFFLPPRFICSKKSILTSGGEGHTPSGICREESFLVSSNFWWFVNNPWHSLAPS